VWFPRYSIHAHTGRPHYLRILKLRLCNCDQTQIWGLGDVKNPGRRRAFNMRTFRRRVPSNLSSMESPIRRSEKLATGTPHTCRYIGFEACICTAKRHRPSGIPAGELQIRVNEVFATSGLEAVMRKDSPLTDRRAADPCLDTPTVKPEKLRL
jgi:hypothetical protein